MIDIIQYRVRIGCFSQNANYCYLSRPLRKKPISVCQCSSSVYGKVTMVFKLLVFIVSMALLTWRLSCYNIPTTKLVLQEGNFL